MKQSSQTWSKKGFLIVTGAFLLLIPVLFFLKIQSAAMAPGILIIESQRKTIAYYRNSLVKDIKIKEGDEVTKGQLLIQVDDTIEKSKYEQTRDEFLSYYALYSRLISELDQKTKIDISESFDSVDLLKKHLEQQNRIFFQRKEKIEGQKAVIQEKIKQNEEQITSLKNQLSSNKRILRTIMEQISMQKPLVKKGLASKEKILQYMIDQAEIEANIGSNQSDIHNALISIKQLEQELKNTDIDFYSQISQELTLTENKLFQLKEKLFQVKVDLERTKIFSPVDGTVVGLSIYTKGGVISAHSTLLQIVPKNRKYIVEALVDPKDIDIINPGDEVSIRLSAYNYRSVEPLSGNITIVSADRVSDPTTGVSAYSIRVHLNDPPTNIKLYPGMQAEVMILKEKRTIMDYLLTPILKGFDRSLKESDQ
ncbi:HlyD family type I secretion periplasmic adaptor subunit [Amphritea sp. 2_MG-2023]|uniref:HlyD family type I secretion periplasmic adaptor subunit n=1 Tax=Amphritea TaxID=515417 RepID=UPI001C06A294|nr:MULTISPECIES: HlyD family type I secretion periplasmic adaptor subunit [Amphritea]MBU2964348.1 HlyD family type I secretion periplasmic adaptor subunit [Amphritea atlantica]MDO6419692.1 HlyD family type I secretion periplasmic adaptor subunit [Amphritea sp. 2_MG-2023]